MQKVRDYHDSTVSCFQLPALLQKVISDLQIGTEYDFVVVVVREGEGGKGPPSPKTTIATDCSCKTTFSSRFYFSNKVISNHWERIFVHAKNIVRNKLISSSLKVHY